LSFCGIFLAVTRKAKQARLKDLPAKRLPGLSPRDRVLRTAVDLFYEHGIHSVGIDRIIAESGVAKMTFYRHFPSKARLIAEYLACKDQAWRELLARAVGDESKTPLERLLAVFDALAVVIQQPGFRGCPFIKSMAEFGPEWDAPEVRRMIAAHFADGEKYVTGLLKQIRPKDSKAFVQPVLSLITGTIVVAQAGGRKDVAARNKEAVKRLLTS
jgi:AcrR family transcriptional regulator